jgi:subtilase family serine protease
MRKVQYISLALLASLLLFVLAIPFGNAMVSDQGNEELATALQVESYYAANPNLQGAFSYQANPVTIEYTSGVPATYVPTNIGLLLTNTVAELQRAYDLNSLYAAGYDGSGQTVVIVDAFGSPTVYADLLSFIQWQNANGANLPWTTMAQVQQHLHIYYPEGYVVFNASNPDEVGWSQEVTLDVDMVHAMASGANIDLVISKNDEDAVMTGAVAFAVLNHLGSVISQSWGDPEWDIAASGPTAIAEMMWADKVYELAAMEHITCFASAGDDGASELSQYYIPPGYNSPNYPASDPYVTAVGGTNLFMNCNASYVEGAGMYNTIDGNTYIGLTYNREIVGNDYEAMAADGYPSPFDIVTTGGAMSQFFPLPYWQQGITMTYANGTAFTPTMRCDSDVSWDSGLYGGLGLVPYTAVASLAGYYLFGGTSMGSPFWAALTAIIDQYLGYSIGYLNPLLYANRATFYKTGAIHDVTVGDNTYPTGSPLIGYEATKGWDAPTGIGSPDATKLVTELRPFWFFG